MPLCDHGKLGMVPDSLCGWFTSTGIMEVETVAVITLHQDVVILQGLENHGGALRHHEKRR
jgi:hypothetical protein